MNIFPDIMVNISLICPGLTTGPLEWKPSTHNSQISLLCALSTMHTVNKYIGLQYSGELLHKSHNNTYFTKQMARLFWHTMQCDWSTIHTANNQYLGYCTGKRQLLHLTKSTLPSLREGLQNWVTATVCIKTALTADLQELSNVCGLYGTLIF